MAFQRRSYEEHVTCPVCMDLLSNPRALPCMHTFCATCLNSYITSVCKTGDEKGFKCPVCKNFTKPPFKGMHPYSWADNFPLNFALKGLVDEMNAKKERDKDVKEDSTSNIDTEKCTSHMDRVIEFECIDHCETFCSVCAALFHRKCEQVNFLGLKETKMMKANLKDQNMGNNSLDKITKHKAVTRLGKSASFDDTEETLPKSIDPQALAHDFAHARTIGEKGTKNKNKHEVTSYVTQHRTQAQSVNQVQLTRGNRSSVEEIHETPIENTRKSLTRLCTNYDEGKKSNDPDDRFHHKGSSSQQRIPLVEAVHSSVDASGYDPYYSPLNSLNDILEEDEDIVPVTIDQNMSKSQVCLTNEFYIRSQYDQRCCSVTGICAIPDGRVLLADEANENVKLFDNYGIYESHLSLESKPWDVTAIGQYEAAVSCPTTKCIHIMLIHDALTITRTIDLDKSCYGITYHSNEIYIAMENEVRIITYDGKVVKKICSESTRKRLFSLQLSIPKALFRSAKYISVNVDGKSVVIVVSDSLKLCVTSMNKRGEILSRLKLVDGGVPYGVSVGIAGELYVCQAPNRLVAINSDEHGNRIKPVVELEAIQAVHYHRRSRLLWVSRKAHNFVMVYTVKKDSAV